MDIYSAQKNIQKLLEYVKEIETSQPRLYNKSKDRYLQIAGDCMEIVNIISSILQTEILNRDSEEFGSDNTDIYDAVESMTTEMNKLKTFTTSSVVESDSDYISPAKRKQAVSAYGFTFRKISEVNTTYPEVQDCAKLLWIWYNNRFFLNKVHSSPFHYNIRRIPNWVRDIVIMYGKQLRDGTISEFKLDFITWCESLYEPTNAVRHAVPYDIYLIGKSPKPSDMSIEAVVIWDELLKIGLDSLCTSNPYDLYLEEDAIYKLCGQVSPEILDRYSDEEYISTVLSNDTQR